MYGKVPGKAFISRKLIILRLCFFSISPKYPQISTNSLWWRFLAFDLHEKTLTGIQFPRTLFLNLGRWTEPNLTKPLNPLNPQRATTLRQGLANIDKLEMLESFGQVMSGDVSCVFLMLYSNTRQVVSWGKIALGKSHVPVAAVWQKVQAKQKKSGCSGHHWAHGFSNKGHVQSCTRPSLSQRPRSPGWVHFQCFAGTGMKNCRNAQDSATNINEGNDGNVPCQAMPSGDVPWEPRSTSKHGGNRCCQRPRRRDLGHRTSKDSK